MVMDRKRSLYFGSLVLLLGAYRGIHAAEEMVHFMSDTDRSEYIFHGKGATLFCNVATKNPDIVKAVRWEFNGTKIVEKKKYTNMAKNTVFTNEIEIPSKDPFRMHIKSMNVAMSGEYKCIVTHEDNQNETSEFSLQVIIDACRNSEWKFTLNKEFCEETIEMKCVGVYPKPLPQCLLINSDIKQSVSSSIKQLPNQTYEISILARYNKKNFQNVSNLTLSCMFLLTDTNNYEFGINRMMFGEHGCSTMYPDAGEGHVNDTNVENTCWDQAASGSTLVYYCNNDKVKALTCVNDTWMDESGHVIISDRPYCSGSRKLETMSTFSIVLAILMLYYY